MVGEAKLEVQDIRQSDGCCLPMGEFCHRLMMLTVCLKVSDFTDWDLILFLG
ncbi:hypothetical protein LguiA_018446 [Lonicera macranthoides]